MTRGNADVAHDTTWHRLFGPGIVVAACFGLLAVVVALVADLPLRDPDGFLGPSYVRLPLIAVAMITLDVVPRVVLRLLRAPQPVEGLATVVRNVVRQRWPARRLAVVATGMGVFYVCYVAYRNLKSFLPFLREDLHDPWLMSSDRWLAWGAHPGDVLHDLLGTGVSADLLSFVYMVFLPLVPLTLAAALVWADDLVRGAWYAMALSLNWILGTVSYYVLPSLGPIYVEAYRFTDLPTTAVSGLQDSLWRNRAEVLADPFATQAVHGIAAFASLHTSIALTAALVASFSGMSRLAQWTAWVFFALTALATVYFGWHYVLDVVAGVALAGAAVALAHVMVVRRVAPDRHQVLQAA